MPKNSWKILKSAITKDNIGKQSGKEYVNLQHPIEDLLRCYGLDLCNYVPPGGMEWIQGGVHSVDFSAAVNYIYTVDTAPVTITTPSPAVLGDSFAVVNTSGGYVEVDDAGVTCLIKDEITIFVYNGSTWNQIAHSYYNASFREAWDVGTIYQFGDIVIDGTDTFVYINSIPDSANLTSDITYWTKIGSTASGGATYINTAFTNVPSVTVTHNLGHYPLVQVLDNTGSVFIPLGIIHNSINDFTITFSSPTTGNILTIG